MQDIPPLFSLNTSKTHEKHAKTYVTYWHARYSITFQPKDLEKHLQYLHLQELATLFLAYVRALNKQTNKRTKREIEKRRRTWQARSSAPPPSSTIAERWMSINVNSSKIKISSLVRRLSPRMEQAQQRAKQVDNRRQKRDLIQKMPLWGEINLKNVAYLTNNL